MNGNPIRSIQPGNLKWVSAKEADKKQIQFRMMYAEDCGLSISCGGVWFELSSGVTDMAIIHPTMTYAMGTHSFGFGFSNRITRVTARFMMIDKEPNTPIVVGGNHVSARKSSVDAAADSTMAIINSGLQNSDDDNGRARFRSFVRGSVNSVWFAANF